MPEYHRRIPADGFSVYARGVWEQIASNKDLDLPTQQELLAQFRCAQRLPESAPLPLTRSSCHWSRDQAIAIREGQPVVIDGLGPKMASARSQSR